MTENNEQYAYFTVVGDFDPADISQSLGIAATESWRKGDVNPRTQLERKCSRWSMYSRLERTSELEAHIADVVEQLSANKRRFVELSSKHDGVMQSVAYFKSSYPGLHFARELVESLAEFSLSLVGRLIGNKASAYLRRPLLKWVCAPTEWRRLLLFT
jgi:hypothetical protein